jgi:ElaB/YqjD/DUF883 family membrane-anchored ribosome-binding protein
MDNRFVNDDSQRRLPMGRYVDVPGYMGSYGSYAGFGAATGIQQHWDAYIAHVDSTISKALPQPVIASIDASPLTSQQKRELKKHPLSVLLILSYYAESQMLEYIVRVRAMAKKLPRRPTGVSGQVTSIKFGNWQGGTVPLTGGRGNPALVAAQALALANKFPLESLQVGGMMMVETGGDIVNMVGAGVVSAVNTEVKKLTQGLSAMQSTANQAGQQAQQLALQAGASLDQAIKEGQKAADGAMKAVSSWFGFGLADGGVASVPAAAAAGTAATVPVWVTSAASVGATIAGVLTAAAAAAAAITPLLMMMAPQDKPGSPPPAAPPVNQAQAAQMNADAAKQQQAKQQLDPAQQQVWAAADLVAAKNSTILGLPPPVVYIGGGVAALGIILTILKKR